MNNNSNMLQLCRLCLVKDDVNIPIFEEQGDIRQIFLKISSCLPVKVSREDQLPKKICDGCSYKLDMLYEFWNTSANAEKQLLTWLGEAGMTSQMADGTISAVAQQIKPADAFVKQETIDPPDIPKDDDDEDEEDKDYMKQEESSNNVTEEPPPKRARRTAAVKAAIALDQNSDDDDDSGEPMTKVEDDSDDSDNDDHEPAFVDVPSTSADDQPGPSGVGKDGVEAPKKKPMPKSRINAGKQQYENLLVKYGIKFNLKVSLCRDITRPIKYSRDNHIYSTRKLNASGTTKGTYLKGPSGKNLYQCIRCNVYLNSIDDVKEHAEINCKFKCLTCRLTYNTVHCIIIHILQHGTNLAKPSQNRKCNQCSCTFPSIIQVNVHKAVAHRTKSPAAAKNTENRFNNNEAEEDEDISCELCFDVFDSNEKLKEHMEFHKELTSGSNDTIVIDDSNQ